MRRVIIRVLFSAILLVQGIGMFAQLSDTTGNTTINWSQNLDYAFLLAQKYNKPIFLFFVDVPPSAISKSVYNSTLSNNIIANKVNDDFIPVQIQGDEVVERKYTVTRYPTLIVLSPTDYTEISRLTGIMSSDSVFLLLQDALSIVDVASDTEKDSGVTSGSSDLTATDESTAVVYRYDGGAFIYLGGNDWVHSSSFYPRINYVQFHQDDVHIYIANRELNVYFAIPQKKKGVFWILKKSKENTDGEEDAEDTWIYAGSIDSVEQGLLSAYIAENTVIQQEN